MEGFAGGGTEQQQAEGMKNSWEMLEKSTSKQKPLITILLWKEYGIKITLSSHTGCYLFDQLN